MVSFVVEGQTKVGEGWSESPYPDQGDLPWLVLKLEAAE